MVFFFIRKNRHSPYINIRELMNKKKEQYKVLNPVQNHVNTTQSRDTLYTCYTNVL